MDTLLQHITLHVKALDPSIPSETARRVGEILEMLIGPAVAGGEALEAISRCILNVKGRMIDLQAQAIVRAAVCWVSLSSDQGQSFASNRNVAAIDPSYQVFLGNSTGCLD